MPKAIQFSVEDLKTPVDLERVLRQFQAAITVAGTTGPASAAPTSLTTQAAALAPLVGQQLQLGGSSPLNLTGLLPSGGGVLTEGTHAQRLAAVPSAANLIFLETDRTVVYASEIVAGAIVWVYVSGMFASAFAGRPTDLGTNDVGFLYWCSDHSHIMRWSGAAWVFTDSGSGYFQDFAVAPTSGGWALCDGTLTSYLTISGVTLVETLVTTPDEVTAVGTVHVSIAAYTGTINAAVAPTFAGTPATLTGNISTPTFTGNAVAAASTNATPHLVAVDLITGVAPVTTATGSISVPALTMNSYSPAGTISIAGGAPVKNLGVLRYFRR